MDKQMIEEMARIIAFDLCPNRSVHARWGEEAQCYSDNNFAECTKIKNVVDKLYNAGYRKIPENAVVLTREEWKRMKSSLYYSKEECERRNQKICKETSEKFAEKLKNKAIRQQEFVGELAIGVIEYVKVKDIDEICKEITDKGVQNGN